MTSQNPKKVKAKAKTKPEAEVQVVGYDFADHHRGNMTTLIDLGCKTKVKRTIVLVEWPSSLLSAYSAGILTGEAKAEAESIIEQRL